MKRALTLTLCAACLPLTACVGWKGGGSVRVEPPQAVFTAPCPHPSQFLGVQDYELMAGRLGDALIDCEARRAGLGAWAAGVAAAVGGK